jgi:hypothetical protein
MNIKEALVGKVYRKIRAVIVSNARDKKYYYFLYKSFWHFLFKRNSTLGVGENNYFSAIPNPGAGIGHQMANWIAGYWFAKQFSLNYAHSQFSNDAWEVFLGLGEDEISVSELVKIKRYKRVRLPLFDEHNLKEVSIIKQIIRSYSNQKVVFVAEQDQFYEEQFGVMEDLQRKFYNAKARSFDKLIYNEDNFNIAIHVRRGDITVGQINKNPNLLMRWQDNDYFVNTLEKVLEVTSTAKPIRVYLFSQGKLEDFKDFNKFPSIEFCLHMGANDSFLHMVYADLLITSKSSFSYKPALLSRGTKIVPEGFWHGYPNNENWIIGNEIFMENYK